MRLHPRPHDFGRICRRILILLGCAALQAIQHLHLLYFRRHAVQKGLRLSYRDRAWAGAEPLTLIAWQDSQVGTPSEHRNAQTIFQRAANRRRWTVAARGRGSACFFSAGLWDRRWTMSRLVSHPAATILQTESSRRSTTTDEKCHPRPRHRSAAWRGPHG